MTDKVRRDREGGASLLLWLADQVVFEQAAVVDAGVYRGPLTFDVVAGRTKFIVVDVRVVATDVEGAKVALVEHAEDLRHCTDMALGQRLTHAERMATKWSQRFDEISAIVDGTRQTAKQVRDRVVEELRSQIQVLEAKLEALRKECSRLRYELGSYD